MSTSQSIQTSSCVLFSVLILLLGLASEAAETWTDTDWSTGNWVTADALDTVSAPGELVMLADSLNFVPAFDATDYDGVWTMVVWRDQLYLGAGQTPPMMEDGGEILVYDYATDTCTLDYELWEQGVAVLKVHDDIIYSPGVDSQALNHHWGNIYYNDGSGWVRKETVPEAAHVMDITFHDGRIWVSAGLGQPDMRGMLYSSSDMGETWVEEFALLPFPPDVLYRRIYAITEFNGSIFIQPDFEQPEEMMLYELKPDSTVVQHDILGYLTHTLAGFQEYRGQLFCLLPHAINSFDGTTWTEHSIPLGSPDYVSRAMTVFRDRLYIAGNQTIFTTEDAESWTSASISDVSGRVFEALAVHHGRVYAGSYPNGEVHVTAVPSVGTLVSESHCFGTPAAWGSLSWQALTPGSETAVRFQLRSAADPSALQSAEFCGPDGSTNSWYENSGTPIAGIHLGHTCFQYRVRLESSEPRLAPVLQEVRLAVEDLTAVPDGALSRGGLQAWPNPFNPRVTLHFDLPVASEVMLAIYDVQGRLVTTLVQESLVAGDHVFAWDGTDSSGRGLAGGLYFARLSTTGAAVTQRLVLIK